MSMSLAGVSSFRHYGSEDADTGHAVAFPDNKQASAGSRQGCVVTLEYSIRRLIPSETRSTPFVLLRSLGRHYRDGHHLLKIPQE